MPSLKTNTADRRRFLGHSAAVLLAATGVRATEASRPKLRIGLVTDLHYADKPDLKTRRYRDTPKKLAEAAKQFAAARIDLLIALGDLVDEAPSADVERQWLATIAKQLAGISPQRHFVLGNHCVTNLTKPEYLAIVGQKQSHYSFDHGGLHLVILDGCFRNDGVAYGRKNFKWSEACIPAEEMAWLETDLRETSLKTLVFVHQRLDVGPPYGVKNAAEVRRVLEASGRVLGVFQGHHHPGDRRDVSGIRYVTLKAMVEGPAAESNAYSILEVRADDSLRLTGFGKQPGF